MSLDHDVSQHFFSNTIGNIPSKEKNRVRSVPASTALSQVSHWSHNAYTTNYHGSGERNGEPLVEPWCTVAIGEKVHLKLRQPWLVKKSSF